ncbi:hypothetical protein [Vibrio harveyi]|uniref:hypothetical protein n=1 Tax=Vibrio harveyi TaxID=669 RepID=UPI0002E03D30|nr:hypothetical protein [Vibrio harveyi]
MQINWLDLLNLDEDSQQVVQARYIYTTAFQKEIAVTMLKMLLPIDLVVTLTGLPLEKIISIELEMASDDMGAYDVPLQY